MSNLSVLHVIGDGSMGGGTTAVLQLASRMAVLGVRVGIVTQPGTELARTAPAQGVTVHELDFSRRLASPLTSRALQRILVKSRPDLVHAHGARAGLPCALLTRRAFPAFVYTVHGFHYQKKRAPLRQLARISEGKCIARADATVFVSQADKALARADGLLQDRQIGEVIYNGSDGLAGAVLRTSTHDVAFLGRLHHQKNPLLLAEIARLATGLRFRIIGDGPLGPALRARVEELGMTSRFSFLGGLSHHAALSALAGSRCMVLPSLWEGLPMAVIEAMHLGLPVVATDMPGLREMILPGKTGDLVPSGDARAFAASLVSLLADDAGLRTLGDAARRRAADLFSLDAQLDRHLALYRRLLSPETLTSPEPMGELAL
ncbi:glycosyltransferase family 4 protein [Pseudoroseomonas globiformis]|uniref:Glycosyltransferase family 4 protein n=1 Tax=Teichococcus globiformis TaxID=2307229 RepID=A0ABV7FWR0_9PROT